MRIQLPQGLGNAFTERLDSTPFLEFNLQQKARKQAREEALNQYFDELPNTINTAGIADKHLKDVTGHGGGGLLDDIDLWRQNGIANKDAILKGGWAREQWLQDYQRILRKAQQAKDATKFELELGKAKFEGKLDPTDEDLEIMKKIGGSIYDPSTYKDDGVSRYGYEDLSPNLPSFDAAKQKALWDAATKGLTPGKVYDYSKAYLDKESGQKIVPFKKMFTPDQIKRIGDEAGDIVSMDKVISRHYKKIVENPESEKYKELNDAFKKVYGSDKFISTPQQAASADAIIRASIPTEEGQEQELNRQQAQQYKINNIIMNKGSGSSGGATVGNALDDFENADYPNFSIKDGVFYKKDGSPYSGNVFVTADKMPGSVKTALKAGGFDISALGRGADAVVKDGQIQSISNKTIGTITRKAMEGVYQLKTDTEPQKGERLRFSDNNPKPNTTKPTGMVTVVLRDGRKGQIPSDKVAQFLKDNPGSKKQ